MDYPNGVASVDLDRVSKSYQGDAPAVADVELHVDDGELVVLVGPSGCGKSTVLRLIAGLETPSSGAIRIGGRVVDDLAPQQRNVAMVFQDYALYPHLSVRRNLEFPLRMRGIGADERRRRAVEVADVLGLSGVLERRPRQLSGGQRQRVAMGRALVRQPDVFLLDEPLSNLDAQLRTQLRGEIRAIQRRTGTTMVYVTHDQAEAMTLGDRVVVLRGGVVQQVASPADLYREPANTFVAGFVGTPPMSLLPAAVVVGAEAAHLEIGGCRAFRLGGGAATWRRTGSVGIRAEDVHPMPPTTPGSLSVRVVQLERLGHETLVHAELAPTAASPPAALVYRTREDEVPREGSTVCVKLDAAGIRLFDAQGEALPIADLS